jgi:hypothetical protein
MLSAKKENQNLVKIGNKFQITGALVAQWLALLTSDLKGPGSNPGVFFMFHVKFVHYMLKKRQLATRPLMCPRLF